VLCNVYRVPPIGPPDPALAIALRRYRELTGDTQEGLAYKCKLTVGSFAKIERGEMNPTWTTLKNIAHGLDMKPAELVSLIEAAER